MSKRIRAGLIGCGGISRQHIGALMQMDNAEIVAVCDIKPEPPCRRRGADRRGADGGLDEARRARRY